MQRFKIISFIILGAVLSFPLNASFPEELLEAPEALAWRILARDDCRTLPQYMEMVCAEYPPLAKLPKVKLYAIKRAKIKHADEKNFVYWEEGDAEKALAKINELSSSPEITNNSSFVRSLAFYRQKINKQLIASRNIRLINDADVYFSQEKRWLWSDERKEAASFVFDYLTDVSNSLFFVPMLHAVCLLLKSNYFLDEKGPDDLPLLNDKYMPHSLQNKLNLNFCDALESLERAAQNAPSLWLRAKMLVMTGSYQLDLQLVIYENLTPITIRNPNALKNRAAMNLFAKDCSKIWIRFADHPFSSHGQDQLLQLHQLLYDSCPSECVSSQLFSESLYKKYADDSNILAGLLQVTGLMRAADRSLFLYDGHLSSMQASYSMCHRAHNENIARQELSFSFQYYDFKCQHYIKTNFKAAELLMGMSEHLKEKDPIQSLSFAVMASEVISAALPLFFEGAANVQKYHMPYLIPDDFVVQQFKKVQDIISEVILSKKEFLLDIIKKTIQTPIPTNADWHDLHGMINVCLAYAKIDFHQAKSLYKKANELWHQLVFVVYKKEGKVIKPITFDKFTDYPYFFRFE